MHNPRMASINQPQRDRSAGRLLREWRLDRGLSPEALSWELRRAKLETVSGRQIRRIEDEGVIPTPRVMFALASFFDARPTEVWRGALRAAA
jgi:transcriptional regulator with XRE-family HTH domain